MAAGLLPLDGELRLGPVRLPAGRRVTPYEHDEPVAWVTRRTVPDPGLVWSALTDLYAETGLMPVVLNDAEDDVDDLFMEPCDVAELDPLDPAELLATRWEGELDDDDDDEEQVHWETPRVNEFLGLKRPGEGGNSLFDIVWAIAKRMEDPEAQAELSRRSELDQQEKEADPEYQQQAARSAEREARRAPYRSPAWRQQPTAG